MTVSYLIILGLIISFSLGANFSFAQTNYESGLTIRTNDGIYEMGDTITILGTVTAVNEDFDIIIQLWKDGDMINVKQMQPDVNGDYSYTLLAEGPKWTEGAYVVRAIYGQGIFEKTIFSLRHFESFEQPEPEPELILTAEEKKIIFEERTREILTTISTHQGVSFRLELERDFDKEYGEKNASYHLYEMFDTKRNDRTGDLRIYLGSSDWWNEKAELQEDDKSGYGDIFKVKIYLQHFTDPEQSQDYANRIANLIKILVPEWSSETSAVSIDQWTSDVINNAPRNIDDKREDSIIIENKEIRILSDDVFWGSITLIVTENFDKTKSNYTVPEDGVLTDLVIGDEKNTSKEDSPEPEKQDDETIKENSNDEPMSKSANDSEGGGCLIATATYGSELAPQVQQLRELRDAKLLQTESGSAFMESFNYFYYSFSPIIADYERENPVFREVVKIAITPMISSLSILNHVDMETDAEVLGYGISLILLNIGMYFVAPVIIIMRFKK